MQAVTNSQPSRGFTFIEVTIVVVIVVVLVSFGVPRYRDAIERTHAAEAVQYLSDLRLAQDRHRGTTGHFASNREDLDLTQPTPKYFGIGEIKVVGTAKLGQGPEQRHGWSLTLTRKSENSLYGAYTVTYNERGFDPERSSLDELPQISPIEEAALLLP